MAAEPARFVDFYRDSWTRLYEHLSLIARSPATGKDAASRAMGLAARRWTRLRSSDPFGWTLRTGLAHLNTEPDTEWIRSDPDPSLSSKLGELSDDVRAAVVVAVRGDLRVEQVAALLGSPSSTVQANIEHAAGQFGVGNLEGLRAALVWHFDAEARSLPVAPADVDAVLSQARTSGVRRLALVAAGGVVAIAAVLAFLAVTQRTITRPDLIQLLPNGVVQVGGDGTETRILEEAAAVAKINPLGAVLYQYDGRSGFPSASIWYRSSVGARSTQVFPLTGGIVGWVDPAADPSADTWRGLIVTATIERSDNGSSTAIDLALLDPETGDVEQIASIGSIESVAGEVVGGTQPIAVAYGGGRILVWTVEATLAASLPNLEAAECGTLSLLSLDGSTLSGELPRFSCDADGVTMSAPALSPDGTTLQWIEAVGVVDLDVPPREGWLSSVDLSLGTFDLTTGRTSTISLTTYSRPTWWTQYTLFSQSTPTLAVDVDGSTSVVSVGIYDPSIEASTYSVFLVDTVGEKVETSIGEGLVTFGR